MAGTRKTRPPLGAALRLVEGRGRRGGGDGTQLPPAQCDQSDQSELLATIESVIIPRLLMAHRTDGQLDLRCGDARNPPNEDEIAEFAQIAACHDLTGALSYVEGMCRAGLSLEVVLLELVAPAARLLGEQWKADLRSFTEVSAGLGTLQQIVHVLGPSFAPVLPHRGLVALVAAPGEQHTLGLYLVGEFLRRAGWGVQVDPAMSQSELFDLLANEWVEMLGFTVSSADLMAPLIRLIAEARKCSRNPRLLVMLGGGTEVDEDTRASGGLLCTRDAREAVRWLESHVESGNRS